MTNTYLINVGVHNLNVLIIENYLRRSRINIRSGNGSRLVASRNLKQKSISLFTFNMLRGFVVFVHCIGVNLLT